MANSEPVVIASNQSAIPITDNSGSLTVDFNDAIVGTPGSAIPAKGVMVQGSDGTNARDLLTTTAGALKIDLSGTAVNATAIKVDGSAVTQPVSGTFWQATQPVSNAGTFAVQDSDKLVDNAGFTDGTTKLMPAGYIYDEVAGTALTENDIAAPRINVNRATVGIIEDGATRARYATVTSSNALKIDGSSVTQPVSGTFWQSTQPVSIAATISSNQAQIGGVSVSVGNGVSGTGVQRVTLASDSTGLVALATGSNTIGAISNIGTSVTPGTAAGNLGKAEDAAHASGDTGVMMLAVRTDTPATTSSTTGDYDAIHTNGAGHLQVALYGHTSGGAIPYKLISAASTNATSVKASAGQVYSVTAMNTNAAVRYLKLYNLSTTPTVGTSTPVQVYALPPGGGLTLNVSQGIEFTTGIALATTTGAADSDTGAVAANEIVISLTYK